MRTRPILITLAVVSLALVITCGDDTCINPGPGHSRGSPEEVLVALAYALEHGDIDIYEECLGPDYRFAFRPEDSEVAGVPKKRPVWERSQDIAAVDSLLRDPSAQVIEAGFVVMDRWPGGPDSLLRCDPHVRVRIDDYYGEEGTLVVCESWLFFYFERDEEDETLWHIAALHEEAIEGLSSGAPTAVLPCSFGELKAGFRYRDECEISPRKSPECLLRSFELSLERMRIDSYNECLHDEYLFSFAPQDAGLVGLPPDEPWWGRTQDLDVMLSMFNDPTVVKTECTLKISAGPWPTDDGIMYRLEPDMKFTISHRTAPEDTTLWVNYSWLYVEIAVDPYDEEKWVFKVIEETLKEGIAGRPAPGSLVSATPHSSFGRVKARYK